MNINNFASEITAWVEDILPPIKLLDECRKIAEINSQITRKILGYAQNNQPIEAYFWGESENCILIYGFPDPGEAIGGTTILALLKKISLNDSFLKSFNLMWIFIPCLNFADQPENGIKLAKVMKTASQEVDWCLDNPREETKVIVDIASTYKPVISFPLHDEFHCNENIPIYFPVSPRISSELAGELRECIQQYSLEIDKNYNDSQMGEGFFYMPEVAKDYANSTFSLLAEHGTVIIFELSDTPEKIKSKLCEIQVAIILKSIMNILEIKQK